MDVQPYHRAVTLKSRTGSNRTLARTETFTQEFDPADTEILAVCYPIESVTKFELKTSETSGWTEQTPPDYLIRTGCIISLRSPITIQNSQFTIARLTYIGGYLLPGAPAPEPSSTPEPCRLPSDLEQAAVEQVAYWYMLRDKLGLIRSWPYQGNYQTFAQFDLLPSVAATLKKHQRWSM
jgi:hypothetical protein